ncbi:uncharacterized protein LOC112567818 isoform X2 [Pomacea canaliculata]|nr:uncharacterized protein LOC112567818 isoform X2 [Pomacea canaliculata]
MMAMKLRTTVIIIMALVWLQAAVVDGCTPNDNLCGHFDAPCCSNSVCVIVPNFDRICKDKGTSALEGLEVFGIVYTLQGNVKGDYQS